jgi:hypothetical protein
MLQINTPNGLYILRERDAKTERTKLIWETLPKSLEFVHCEDHANVEELMVCIGGDDYSLIDAVNIREMFPTISDINIRNFQCANAEPVKYVYVICTDRTMLHPEATLRRRFQLIDDYLNDNPIPDGEEASITLPFSYMEVSDAFQSSQFYSLLPSYDALCYLNPKSNLYFFYYDLDGISLDILTKLSNNLTAEERANLVQYGTRRGWKVPSTEGIYILGLLDSVRSNIELMREIYEKEYPSYLFCTIYQFRIPGEQDITVSYADLSQAIAMLLTCDFTVDPVVVYDQKHVLDCVTEVIMLGITMCDTPLSDCRILAKMGGISEMGEGIVIPPLPYDVPPSDSKDHKIHVMSSLLIRINGTTTLDGINDLVNLINATNPS